MWPIRVLGGDHNRYVCHYCGMPANTLDHIPPVASYNGNDERFRVPACSECNSLLRDVYHNKFPERRHYLKILLTKRYAGVLTTPKWTEQELNDLGPDLRESIQMSIKLKKIIDYRLSFSCD